ncbi:cytochrome c3 family protein [Ferrimonas senticii]|uniref:cytochrome c3 family protein n=1 Tax=Ferrimonas senticii TaxID=394566 RepID=UPI0006847580|nr:cytochrome c3 family protein [Ferrimonas senticii]
MKPAFLLALSLVALQGYPMEKSRHLEVGLECIDCHAADLTKFANEQVCLECHEQQGEINLEAINQRPGHSLEIQPDPHYNVHFGNTLNCTACHSEHAKSEIYCNYCHQFKYPNFDQE